MIPDEMEKDPVSKWVQLKAMLVRNVLLKKRLGRKTLAECIVPFWFLTLLVVIKSLLPNPNYPAIPTQSADTPLGLNLALNGFSGNASNVIYIVPNNNETARFADEMLTYWRESLVPIELNEDFYPSLEFVFLENETQLEAIYAMTDLEKPVQLAVVFDDDPFVNMSYTIRNHPDTATIPAPSRLFASGDACRNPNASMLYPEYNYLGSCPINSYFYSNFLAVQSIVEGTWLKLNIPMATIRVPKYLKDYTMQLFPKGPYVDNTSLSVLRYLVPFYMVLTLSQFILYLLSVVVGEKEKKIKEGFRMMGLSDSVYWASWFVVYFVFVVVLTLVSTGVLYGLGVFRNSNVGLVYLLFILYDLSVLMMAFLITPFFDKARVAGLFGAMAVSFLNLFYYVQVATGDATPTWVYWVLALISPTGFALGMDKALLLEITTPQGVQLDSLWAGPGLPLAGSYIMLSVDIVLYVLLAYYLDNVLPSEYGARKSPWFCLVPSFWCRPERTILNGELNGAYDGEDFKNEDIEPVPVSMRGKEVLRIRGLSKTFKPFGKPEIKAVKGLNLDVYEGQITAILGHNGAGKTTLFNMLTGMTSPTKGSAYLYGYDLSDTNQLEEIRRMTGVCPQHDVLFDQLTPREHLEFFAKIRGVRPDAIDKEVEKTLKDVDLTSKANTLAINLSGGQKRKLSIGVALIGDPKIVFLGEPTAGVDPYSRRHLWNLLQERKANKVILLTTHFMDEADLLADRKAIVSQGKLRCLGSSLFLKNKFGLGYHLTFVLNENFRDTETLRRLVESYVAEAKPNRHYGRELSYVLPRHQVSAFPDLFSQLERLVSNGEAEQMGFSSYGVSMTTLEEVFLKLGEEAEQEKLLNSEQLKSDVNGEKMTIEEKQNATWEQLNNLDVPIREKHTGQTLRALLKMRGINMARDPMAVFFQVLMPVVFAALGIWLGTLSTERTVETKQHFTLEKYHSQLSNQPFLYYEDAEKSMASFWTNFANWNDLTISNYSGSFTEILDLLNEQGMAHSFAVDTKDIFEWNTTVYNQSISELPLKHSRLRFNDTLMHMPPILLNTISNTLLMSNGIENNISLHVHPLPYTNPPGEFDPGQFTSAMFIGMLFVLAPSALACEIVLDREIHAKNLLRVNGLTFGLYYGSFFIVLGSMMVTTCILILLLIVAFHLQALVTPVALSLLAILYILFCPAAILFATCASYLFDTLESAQSIFPNVSSLIGFVPYLIVMLCDMFQVGGSTDLATALHIGFCFIDVLYIPYGILYYVNRIYFQCLLTPTFGEDVVDICQNLSFSDYMTPEIISIFVALLVHIPLYYVLLVIIDVKSDGGKVRDAFRCFQKQGKTEVKFDDVPEVFSGLGDSDVKEEYVKIRRLIDTPVGERDESPVVIVQDLHKKYKSSEDDGGCCNRKKVAAVKPPAVQTLSFAVQPGEVFGLLGHNGAGKTTTMKVITAEEAPTRGRVQVAGHDIISNQSEAFQALGYCPQHDALWRNITVREHMETYAAIRGIEPSHIKRIVDLFLRGLQIEEHANKYAKDCSGGTRRKLSYALSMLGRPSIVLMDEPSTGMDPQSKRFLWNTISASFRGKRGAILTTHSMEEADALCSRLGIMVKGELRCIGTGQHLKNRYGSGYLLEVKLNASTVQISRSERRDGLIRFVNEAFTNVSVQESFEDRIIFNIPQESIASLSDTFKALESAREKLNIEEYSFSQTTLEQVFIKFAHEQEDEDAAQ